MQENNQREPWVSFCISTYKRSSFLKQQLQLLLQQTNADFAIVISDNDPDASGRTVVESFNDPRIRYFHNGDNLGMINSFNKSIERANTEFIVMVTDDDPVDIDFLEVFWPLINKYPGHSVYGGFIRSLKKYGEVEQISKDEFLEEILDPRKTSSLLWSSCILRRNDVLQIGKLPDRNGPHLSDHALLAMTGSVGGGIVVNKMYSNLTSHENNFSKFNLDLYVIGGENFYNTLTSFSKQLANYPEKKRAIVRHLGKWVISSIFGLKRYHTIHNNKDNLAQINKFAKRMLAFPFMRPYRLKYHFKNFVFKIKRAARMLKS
jgi:glycosyltransferase involved in cell wall biosynthesis